MAVGGPVGEDAFADEVVGELGETVFRVCFEGSLEALVCFTAVAFPPLNDAQAGEYWRGVGAVGAHVELEEELGGAVDTGPLRTLLSLS